jgi:ankyrin repeat protein
MGVYDALEAALAPDALPKVNVNMMTCFGETLLHTAVLNQRQAIVQLLLAHGADMNIEIPRMSFEKEQLHIKRSSLTRSENFRLSRILHANEATPVHYACLVGNLEILKTMIGWKGPNTFVSI